MKKLTLSFFTLLMVISLSTNTYALGSKKAPNKVEENYSAGSALVTFSNLNDIQEIILYADEQSGTTIGFTIQRVENLNNPINGNNGGISTMGFWVIDNGTWSSGYLPVGTFTLSPWIRNLGSNYEVSFKVDAINNGSYVTLGNIRNSIVNLGSVYAYSTIAKKIVRDKSTPTYPALAQLTFKTALSWLPLDWKDAYLKIEVNNEGQTRVSWKYYEENIFVN